VKNTHRTAAAAAALLAAGVVTVGTAESAGAATPSAQRISASQLKSSIAQAVTLEKIAGVRAISPNPAGRASALPTMKAACSN
jgi:hypothetical protein